VLIVEHKLGLIMANAGIDQSNVAPQDGVERALLLPKDPDASAEALRSKLGATAVLIIDSFGRPWRKGTTGVAIGAAGLPSFIDMRGMKDMFGRVLQVTMPAFADEIAAAASLVMGQDDEALPVVIVRGLTWKAPSLPASELIRASGEDLFR
jgi:coenzyme F420-0:L-glutamate ligase/coenzyme F420-1:gamma-L-glutamate ligase